MKKLIAILSVLALTGVQTGWADILGLGEITADGSLEVAGQIANNEVNADDTAKDTRGGTNTRVRIGLNAEITEEVSGRVEAVRTGRRYGTGATSVATEEGMIAFQNAYIDIADFLQTDSFRLGRQYGGRKGDLLLYYAPYNDDSLTVNALDGLTVSKKWNKINIMAGTGKAAEDDALANTDADDVATAGDSNVSWVVLGSDELVPDIKVPLELGFYTGTDNNATAVGDNVTLTIIDIRASTMLMDDTVNVGIEYAQNGGQANGAGPAGAAADFKGNALLLHAEYNNEEGGWGAHLRYANASGDDPSSATPTADDDAFHDFSIVGFAASDYRIGEILSNSNASPAQQVGLDTGLFGNGLNVVNLGGMYKLPVMDGKITGHLDYYVSKVNETGPGVDDGVGTEIDLTFSYAHSENVSAVLGYATFSPDKGLLTGYASPPPPVNPKDDPATKLFGKLMVRWGGERVY